MMSNVFIILFSFLISKGSWIAAVITALLMGIALLGFASLAANIARSNTLDRLYRQDILPEIDRTLEDLGVSQLDFNHFASRAQPGKTLLGNYLLIPNDGGDIQNGEQNRNEE